MKKLIPLFLVTAFTTGCATTLPAPDNMRVIKMKSAEIMPSESDLKGHDQTAIILPTKVTTTTNSTDKQEYSSTYEHQIKSLFNQINMEVIDRSKLTKELQAELKLAELKQELNYTGPQVPSYVVYPVISEITHETTYKPSEAKYDANGKKFYTKAQCTLKTSVKGSIDVSTLKDMKHVHSEETYGYSSKTEDTNSRHCRLSFGSDKKHNQALIAIGRSINNKSFEILNAFAPKAYVLEFRADEEHRAFKVNKGKNNGLFQNQVIVFYKLSKSQNPITGEDELNEVKIAKGRVSDRLGSNYAWVSVDDKERWNKIYIGDYGKIDYKPRW